MLQLEGGIKIIAILDLVNGIIAILDLVNGIIAILKPYLWLDWSMV